MEGEASLLERERELAALERLLDRRGARRGARRPDRRAGRDRQDAACSPSCAQRRRRTACACSAARGSELEREFSFGVVRQLFEPRCARPGRARALLGGRGGRGRGRVRRAGDGDAATASFAALHGLYWLTLNLAAERPLLLAIDDLHWCDRPSLRFVAYLARRLEGAAGARRRQPCARPSPGADPRAARRDRRTTR